MVVLLSAQRKVGNFWTLTETSRFPEQSNCCNIGRKTFSHQLYVTPRENKRGKIQLIEPLEHQTVFLVIPLNTSSKRGAIRARIAVARLWALSGPLALAMPLAVRAVAKSDPELFPTATGLSALAPVTPVTPAICRFKDKRKQIENPLSS